MSKAVVALLAKDLNPQGGVYCPNPAAHMKLWNSHPRVYLDVARTGTRNAAFTAAMVSYSASPL